MRFPAGAFDHVRNAVKRVVLDVLPEPMLIPLRKIHYVRVLRTVTEAYDSDFTVLKHLINKGDHVVDLGAHVGTCTKFLSDLVGPDGHVYSVEPFPSSFNILRYNIKKLALKNVELINCAVSNTSGRMTMEVPRFTELGESFYDARIVSKGSTSRWRQAEVDVNTVDSLFIDMGNEISFVKCDVEGQELECLSGAKELISRDGPAWLIEISQMEPPIHQRICDLLSAAGYNEFWFDGTNLKRLQRGDQPINAFFLQAKHLAALAEAGVPGCRGLFPQVI